MQNSLFEQLPFGITCIDTGLVRPRLAGCYLMRHNDSAAVIETGTRHTVPRILSVIEYQGLRPEQVEYVIVTHVHLDHAGGAGTLLQQLPNAKLVVHPRGARHMIEPQKLQAGTEAVYGEAAYQQHYGDLEPVAEERVVIAEDGDELNLGGRLLKFIDTPGHARHHFCVYDPHSQGIFSGDTLGLVYRELTAGFDNFVLPSTTPVQFDPSALRESIAKLLALNPRRAFLTHFGMVENLPSHCDHLLQAVEQYELIAQAHRDDDKGRRQQNIKNALYQYTWSELQKNGTSCNETAAQEILMLDMELNAQGLDVWLDNAS